MMEAIWGVQKMWVYILDNFVWQGVASLSYKVDTNMTDLFL